MLSGFFMRYIVNVQGRLVEETIFEELLIFILSKFVNKLLEYKEDNIISVFLEQTRSDNEALFDPMTIFNAFLPIIDVEKLTVNTITY